jgi:hypothetical protein
VSEAEDLVDSEDLCYKYRRLVSCDLESTFSEYKSLLCDNRQRFKIHNLKMPFLVHCNSASLSAQEIQLLVSTSCNHGRDLKIFSSL